MKIRVQKYTSVSSPSHPFGISGPLLALSLVQASALQSSAMDAMNGYGGTDIRFFQPVAIVRPELKLNWLVKARTARTAVSASFEDGAAR